MARASVSLPAPNAGAVVVAARLQLAAEPSARLSVVRGAGFAGARGADGLGVAGEPVLVGAFGTEVLTGQVDAVAVAGAGVGDVGGVAVGDGVPERSGAIDGGALSGTRVHRVRETQRRPSFTA